jgi:hypothetical protein
MTCGPPVLSCPGWDLHPLANLVIGGADRYAMLMQGSDPRGAQSAPKARHRTSVLRASRCLGQKIERFFCRNVAFEGPTPSRSRRASRSPRRGSYLQLVANLHSRAASELSASRLIDTYGALIGLAPSPNGSRRRSGTHVAIYVGGDLILYVPRTGDVGRSGTVGEFAGEVMAVRRLACTTDTTGSATGGKTGAVGRPDVDVGDSAVHVETELAAVGDLRAQQPAAALDPRLHT